MAWFSTMQVKIAFGFKKDKTMGFFLKILRHPASEIQGELTPVLHLYQKTLVLRRRVLKLISAVERVT